MYVCLPVYTNTRVQLIMHTRFFLKEEVVTFVMIFKTSL